MDFKSAVEAMKNGKKVTRQQWAGSIYFIVKNNHVYSFQPVTEAFRYTEDIMLSEGWLTNGEDTVLSFVDLIPYLMKGFKAWRKDWVQKYIIYSSNDRMLVQKGMQEISYNPSFDAFLANDWKEVEVGK